MLKAVEKNILLLYYGATTEGNAAPALGGGSVEASALCGNPPNIC